MLKVIVIIVITDVERLFGDERRDVLVAFVLALWLRRLLGRRWRRHRGRCDVWSELVLQLEIGDQRMV